MLAENRRPRRRGKRLAANFREGSWRPDNDGNTTGELNPSDLNVELHGLSIAIVLARRQDELLITDPKDIDGSRSAVPEDGFGID